MSLQDDEITKVAVGSPGQVELWQGRLQEAGIESRVVGEDLTASIGSMLPG
jgi:hypothetical protein